MTARNFTDREGDRWSVFVDLPLARDLSRTTPFDVLNPDDFSQLMNSMGARLEMLWLVVRPQAEDQGVQDFREFEKRLHGGDGHVFDASDALVLALIDFFRRLGLTPLVTLGETLHEAQRTALEATQTKWFQQRVRLERDQLRAHVMAEMDGEAEAQAKRDARKAREKRKRRKRGKR